MSKKKRKNKYLYDRVNICESIESKYLNSDHISNSATELTNKLSLLIDNYLACKINASEWIGNPYATMYRIASKFIQKYNKSLSEYRRALRKFEFGNENTITSKNNPELIKLTKYTLENGKYFAQLDKSNYCV